MNRQVRIHSSELGEDQLKYLAKKYQEEFELPVTIVMNEPDILAASRWADLAQVDDMEKLLRYWSIQSKILSKMLAETYPLVNDNKETNELLSVLALPWDDDPKGTVIYYRTTTKYSISIVLRDFSISRIGQLEIKGAPTPLPPRHVIEPERPKTLAESGGGEDVQKAIWNILDYIGAGLAEAGSPILGAVFSVLMDLLKAFSSTADDQMTELLSQIKMLLQDDRIQLEMDSANAVILTWSEYEGSHFKESDLEILNADNPDTSSQSYIDAKNRISSFVTKINNDLNGTPRILDAVNLMRGDPDKNAETYDFPTDGMLKLSYFMFYSGFVLALGKQAWLASRALNGVSDSTTESLQNQVAFLSQNYTEYVEAIYPSINQQVSERAARWDVEDTQPLDGHTFFIIHDTIHDAQDPLNRLNRYSPPSEWGYTGSTWFSYCGNSQRATANQQADAALVNLKQTYIDYFYGRIVKSASDGRSMQQELDARVAAYKSNNAKYQNLAKSDT